MDREIPTVQWSSSKDPDAVRVEEHGSEKGEDRVSLVYTAQQSGMGFC